MTVTMTMTMTMAVAVATALLHPAIIVDPGSSGTCTRRSFG